MTSEKFIEIGHSQYIPLAKLEKFNRRSKNYKYLRNFYRELERSLVGIRRKRTYIDISSKIRVTSIIDPEIYYRLQHILLNITGRLWPFDELLDFLLNWFIFVYRDTKQPYKVLPFVKKQIKQDNIVLVKFNDRFDKYYKNMMRSWKEDI